MVYTGAYDKGPHRWAPLPTCDFSDTGRECHESSDTSCVELCRTKPMNINCTAGLQIGAAAFGGNPGGAPPWRVQHTAADCN